MDKTLKRQIAYKPEKKPTVKTNGVMKGPKVLAKAPECKPETKMGRKPKPPQDIVKIAHVWITDTEKEELEVRYGSLTKAIKSLL